MKIQILGETKHWLLEHRTWSAPISIPPNSVTHQLRWNTELIIHIPGHWWTTFNGTQKFKIFMNGFLCHLPHIAFVDPYFPWMSRFSGQIPVSCKGNCLGVHHFSLSLGTARWLIIKDCPVNRFLNVGASDIYCFQTKTCFMVLLFLLSGGGFMSPRRWRSH